MGQNRSDQRDWKKDQQIKREVLDELEDHVRDGADYKPRYPESNRDQARGDLDRTGRRFDEGIETE